MGITALKLEVATPSGLALQAHVDWVQAPSVEGEFGVEPEHIPLLAVLKSGTLRYRSENKVHLAVVGPGFVEVGREKVLLLTEKFCRSEEIQPEQIREELERADLRLRTYHGATDDPDYVELQRDSDWARACLNALEEQSRTAR